MNSDLIRLAYDFPVTTFVPFGPFDLAASGSQVVVIVTSGPIFHVGGFITSSPVTGLNWVFFPSASSGMPVELIASNFVQGPQNIIQVSFCGFKLSIRNTTAGAISNITGFVGYGQPDYAAWSRELQKAKDFFPRLNDEVSIPSFPGSDVSLGTPLSFNGSRPAQTVNMPFLTDGRGQW